MYSRILSISSSVRLGNTLIETSPIFLVKTLKIGITRFQYGRAVPDPVSK